MSSLGIPANVPSSNTPTSYIQSPSPSVSRQLSCVTSRSNRSAEEGRIWNLYSTFPVPSSSGSREDKYSMRVSSFLVSIDKALGQPRMGSSLLSPCPIMFEAHQREPFLNVSRCIYSRYTYLLCSEPNIRNDSCLGDSGQHFSGEGDTFSTRHNFAPYT